MTPEARAARERKQKIFVVVGGLFLVALLALQLPKLLGGSSSPEAAAATTTDSTAAPSQPAPVVPGTATPAVAAARVTTGRLTSFTVFSRKDPFVQQAVTPSAGEGDGAGSGGSGGAGAGGGSEKPPSEDFSTAPKPAATVVVVNGARQTLELGQKFPSSDPVFVLVAEQPKSKSVLVGIVGGGYASGGDTTTLRVGKPLTLVNTTTGARYKITLVSVGSGGTGDPGKSQAQP